ncbi:MAG: rhomboid family intramembrane serine protease [Pseudomonadota bacterium]
MTENNQPGHSADPDTRLFVARRDWSLALICGLCISIELILQASDLGWIEFPRLRQATYEFAGFWPGLLRDWGPNYAGQPALMFLTYGFLHGGLGHLVVNMITLWSLGRATLDRVGTRAFCILYALSVLGGAFGYGLIGTSLQPMVGASGALFGLAGALLAWDYIDRYTFEDRLWPVARTVLFLIALNAILYIAMAGQLAWQTHLGGFIAGWIAAMLIDPRSRDHRPTDT